MAQKKPVVSADVFQDYEDLLEDYGRLLEFAGDRVEFSVAVQPNQARHRETLKEFRALGEVYKKSLLQAREQFSNKPEEE